MNISVLLIALVTSASCSILGVYLVLRKMSMIVDAISHTILLGIVLGFAMTHSLTSPLLMIGAVIIGLVTVYLIELLVKTRRMNEDAATGIIFPLLFSIAVIMISMEFSHVHLDIDMVLVGNILLSSFEQLTINGINLGPKMLYIMSGVLIINVVFVSVWYKELKIVSFDPLLASILGFSPFIIHYVLMGLISLTAVAAFNVMGSILVIALMIGPPISALMVTNRLHWTLLSSAIIGSINTIMGYQLAIILDVSVSGMIATVTLIVFLLFVSVSPKKGLIIRFIKRRQLKESYAMILLLLHLSEHDQPSSFTDIRKAFDWSNLYSKRIIYQANSHKYLEVKEESYTISKLGKEFLALYFEEQN